MRASFSSVASIAFLLPFILHTVVKAENMQASFLSASFSTRISPVTDSLFDDIKKEAFCNATQHFFKKIFTDHDANIHILNVGVFDEHITKQSGADIPAEKLRFRQYPRDHELTLSTVVVAQHLDEKKLPLMSSEHFYQNVLYASNEFQDHFLTFLSQSEDLYFTGVDSVLFDKYYQASKQTKSVG